MVLLYLIGGIILWYSIVFIIQSLREYLSKTKRLQLYRAKLKQLGPALEKVDIGVFEARLKKYTADITLIEQEIKNRNYIQKAQNISTSNRIIEILDNKRV
jgi:hypothetical protein